MGRLTRALACATSEPEDLGQHVMYFWANDARPHLLKSTRMFAEGVFVARYLSRISVTPRHPTQHRTETLNHANGHFPRSQVGGKDLSPRKIRNVASRPPLGAWKAPAPSRGRTRGCRGPATGFCDFSHPYLSTSSSFSSFNSFYDFWRQLRVRRWDGENRTRTRCRSPEGKTC